MEMTLPSKEVSTEPGAVQGPRGAVITQERFLGNNAPVSSENSRKLIPSQTDLAWPTLCAIKRAGGAATNNEIMNAVASDLELTEVQMAVLCGHGSRTLLDYRLAWTRTLLRRMGAIANDAPCHWSITQVGMEVTHEDIQVIVKEHFDNLTESSHKKQQASPATAG